MNFRIILICSVILPVCKLAFTLADTQQNEQKGDTSPVPNIPLPPTEDKVKNSKREKGMV